MEQLFTPYESEVIPCLYIYENKYSELDKNNNYDTNYVQQNKK